MASKSIQKSNGSTIKRRESPLKHTHNTHSHHPKEASKLFDCHISHVPRRGREGERERERERKWRESGGAFSRDTIGRVCVSPAERQGHRYTERMRRWVLYLFIFVYLTPLQSRQKQLRLKGGGPRGPSAAVWRSASRPEEPPSHLHISSPTFLFVFFFSSWL